MTHTTSEEHLSPAERKKSFKRRFWINLVMGLLLAWGAFLLPMSEGAKRIVTRIWGPVLTASYPETGRDQVTVMLVDDEDLRAFDEVWPVPLGFHKRRLLELLKYHPKAVFFDIVFLDDRRDPELDGFIDAACRARAAGVPVFVGSLVNAGKTPSRTEQAMLARTVEVGGMARSCIQAAYLNLRIDGFDQSVWEYDLAFGTETHHAEHAEPTRYPSPAARLYGVDHTLAPAELEEPMALVWGTASDPNNLAWMNNEARQVGSHALCASTWRWHRVLPVGEPGPPMCPYQRLLPARTLNGANGFDAADLQRAIGGKYIVYGTHLQSTGDEILSPYHGRISGAFLHAMALDNLLAFKGEPKQAGEFGHSSQATLFIVIAVAVISLLMAGVSVFPADRLRCHWPLLLAKRWQRPVFGICLEWLVTRLLGASAMLLIVVVLIGLSYYWFRLGPLVWIEYAVFPLGLHFLHFAEKVEHAWKTWPATFRLRPKTT